MKNKILLLFLSILAVSILGGGSLQASVTMSSTDPVDTKKIPSESFLEKEKQSVAASVDYSPIVMTKGKIKSSNYASLDWGDPILPGEGGETGGSGNVGGPIGDATLPVVLSLLGLYLIFRTVTTSRRKNNI